MSAWKEHVTPSAIRNRRAMAKRMAAGVCVRCQAPMPHDDWNPKTGYRYQRCKPCRKAASQATVESCRRRRNGLTPTGQLEKSRQTKEDWGYGG
jgi:hypothetical protein